MGEHAGKGTAIAEDKAEQDSTTNDPAESRITGDTPYSHQSFQPTISANDNNLRFIPLQANGPA